MTITETPTGGPYSLPQVQEDLRVLRTRAGEPSFRKLSQAITESRRARGLPETEAYISRSTVYDCFGKTRKRIDAELVLDILRALNVTGSELQTWQRRLEAALGHAAASTVVTVSDQLSGDAEVFVGRAEQLTMIEQHLRSSEGGIVWISGMPGIGKTTLAAEIARRFVAQNPEARTLHADLRGFSAQGPPTEPRAVLEALLRQLGVSTTGHFDTASRAATLRSTLSGSPHLLILDDAADAEQVAPIVPEIEGLRVLVTSRTAGKGMADAFHVQLGAFSEGESLSLLGQFAGQEKMAGESEAAAGLVQAAGHLPLVLRLTGARLSRQSGWSLQDHLDLASSRRDALRLEDPVSEAFGTTYEALPEDAQTMLRLLAVHSVAMLDTPSAEALADSVVEDPAAALQSLMEHSLLTQPDPNRYVLHELLRVHAADLSMEKDPPGWRRQALQRLHRYALNGLWSAYTAKMKATYGIPREPRVGIEVYEMSVEQADQFFENSTDLLLLIAYSGESPVQGHEAEAPHSLLAVSEAINGWLFRSRRLQEAIELHRAAMELSAELGDEQGEVLARLEYGTSMSLQGASNEALEILLEVEHQIPEHSREAPVLENALGHVYGQLGEPEKAKQRLKRCIQLAGASGDVKHQIYGWNTLAGVHVRLGELDQAKSGLEKSLQISQRIGDEEGVARCAGNLGYLLTEQNENVAAEKSTLQALEYYESLQSHPGAILMRINLASIRFNLERWEGALESYVRGYDEAQEAAILDYQIMALNGLAQTNLKLSRPDAGEQYIREALALAQETESPFEQGNSLLVLGDCVAAMERPEEAQEYWREAEQLFEQIGASRVEWARSRLAGASQG